MPLHPQSSGSRCSGTVVNMACNIQLPSMDDAHVQCCLCNTDIRVRHGGLLDDINKHYTNIDWCQGQH